uniref:Uncharacterized protein n=1 Tax=Opuntia streptacantha TaxID=393608 RepID=A0A7C8Z695_OPUST
MLRPKIYLLSKCHISDSILLLAYKTLNQGRTFWVITLTAPPTAKAVLTLTGDCGLLRHPTTATATASGGGFLSLSSESRVFNVIQSPSLLICIVVTSSSSSNSVFGIRAGFIGPPPPPLLLLSLINLHIFHQRILWVCRKSKKKGDSS